jgi:enoyl-CoA hydratase/carnithine racemase
MNRPAVRNALSRELCVALVSAIGTANEDRSVGAILLEGEGAVFCGGMDLKEDRGENLGELHAELFSIGTRLTKPMVAAVRGAAIAGGLGLALNAHVIMAAADARFGLTETRIGLWPYAVYPVVTEAVGPRRARELAISARIVDAETALRLGLVEHVVRAEELEAKSVELASTLAEGSAEAVANGLLYVQSIEGLGTAQALQQAVRSRVAVEASADFAEGVRAFREKRAARWPSHR